jgi:hypothetical protein
MKVFCRRLQNSIKLLFVIFYRLDKKLDWTPSYIYAEQTNYLLKHDKDKTLNDYEYDAHGNMTKMPHLQSMIWTVNDELQ